MKNKASGIGASLKKKYGPLPAWAWILMFGVGVWYYRNKLSGGSVESGTGTGSVSPAPTTPQPVTTLGPGEGAYDPNTGTLSTNPGGDGFGNSTDWASIFGGLTNAITGAIGAVGGGSGSGQGGGSTPGGGKKTPTKGRVQPPAHVGRPKTGTTKRTPKPKHGPPKPTTKPPTHGKTRVRSSSSLRSKIGGRTRGHTNTPTKPGQTRGGVKPQANKPRQLSTKGKTSVVTKPVVKQRTATGHNTPAAKPAPKPAPRPAPRPSAPPARSVSRTVATKKKK